MTVTRPDNHGTTSALPSIRPGSAAQNQQWEAASRSRERSVQVALIQSAFSDIGWKVSHLLRGIDAADDLYFQITHQIRMAKWHRNRIVCLRDTAYAPTPFTSMDTSLAIDGAYLLAGHLSQLEPGQHPALAFDRYDQQFRPFVVHKQTLPFYVPAIRHPTNAVSKWAAESYFAARARMARMP
jgi:2-polyprenyl-6-methoxyphenol hydroxylase-like FAD-dependent oxidoreductase